MRPTSKKELLLLSAKSFDTVLTLVSKIPASASADLNGRDKNSRDVIAHLHEWHLMTMKWYQDGISGITPIMPAVNYTWKTTAELNRVIWAEYQTTKLETTLGCIRDSHNKIMELIEKHTDEELFTKKYYTWTKTTSLGSWFSATSSHYYWAIKLLKKLQ